MTKEEIKDQIDLDITNKTTVNSVTPTLVGDNIKNIIDFLPNLIMTYEGDINSSTTLTFSDEILNVYKVTENFTFRSTPLKIGNIVGINESLLIILSKNQEDFVKSINTTLVPDLTGNLVIPNASVSQPGLVSNSSTMQTFFGPKTIQVPNGTGNNVFVYEIKDNTAGTNKSFFNISENGWIRILERVFFRSATDWSPRQTDVETFGTETVARMQRNGDRVSLSEQSSLVKGITIDLATGNISIGSIGTTTEIFEIFSTTKGSIPFPRMSYLERTGFTPTKTGTHVYQINTDVGSGSAEGVYVWKTNNWVFAY